MGGNNPGIAVPETAKGDFTPQNVESKLNGVAWVSGRAADRSLNGFERLRHPPLTESFSRNLKLLICGRECRPSQGSQNFVDAVSNPAEKSYRLGEAPVDRSGHAVAALDYRVFHLSQRGRNAAHLIAYVVEPKGKRSYPQLNRRTDDLQMPVRELVRIGDDVPRQLVDLESYRALALALLQEFVIAFYTATCAPIEDLACFVRVNSSSQPPLIRSWTTRGKASLPERPLGRSAAAQQGRSCRQLACEASVRAEAPVFQDTSGSTLA